MLFLYAWSRKVVVRFFWKKYRNPFLKNFEVVYVILLCRILDSWSASFSFCTFQIKLSLTITNVTCLWKSVKFAHFSFYFTYKFCIFFNSILVFKKIVGIKGLGCTVSLDITTLFKWNSRFKKCRTPFFKKLWSCICNIIVQNFRLLVTVSTLFKLK